MLLPDDHADTGVRGTMLMLTSFKLFVGVFVAVLLLAILSFVVLLLVLWRRRTPPDPRAGWPTMGGVSVWFEDPATGTRWMPGERRDRLVVGSSGDCSVPRTRARHALVRVFGRGSVDICAIGGAMVHVGGQRIRGPVWIKDDDCVRLGGVELVVHIGWEPDADDPRIGSIVAGERLLERCAGGRYACARGVVELLEPPVDAVAYGVRIRASERLAPELLWVVRVEAGGIVVEGGGELKCGALAPETVVMVGRILAPLHAAGIGHGGLDRALYVAPGRVRLWPVAPGGDVEADLEALRGRLPGDWPALAASDVRGLMRAVLRHGGAAEGAAGSWGALVVCTRCGEPFARPDPPNTTMFDGHDSATGRSFGGKSTEHRVECLGCGHVDVRVEHEAY